MAVILAPWDLSSLAVPGEILFAEFGSIVNVRFAAGARALLAKSEDLQSDQSCVNKPLMNFIVRLMPRAMLSYIICIAARKRDVAKLTSFHHDPEFLRGCSNFPLFPRSSSRHSLKVYNPGGMRYMGLAPLYRSV